MHQTIIIMIHAHFTANRINQRYFHSGKSFLYALQNIFCPPYINCEYKE